MYNSRLLTLFGGVQRYVDTFDVLPARLIPLVGTLAVSGGALRAATAGGWLESIVANGESWTGGPPPTGWLVNDALTPATVDSTADPGAVSPGADAACVKLTRTDDSALARFLYQAPAAVVGAGYIARTYAYAPSANTQVNAAQIGLLISGGWTANGLAAVSAEDAWQTLTLAANVATSVNPQVRLYVVGATLGDIAYYDTPTLFRQNTPALVAGWRSPNFIATLDHISPASPSVVPFSWLCRYTDPLNYFEVRVLPNTAGNDLQIVQVTAGVETVRAAADVDWTAGGTDQLEVSALGATISTRYKKAGGAWAAGPSYTAATQGQGLPQMGPMYWGLSTGRLAGWDLRGH